MTGEQQSRCATKLTDLSTPLSITMEVFTPTRYKTAEIQQIAHTLDTLSNRSRYKKWKQTILGSTAKVLLVLSCVYIYLL